MNTGPGPRSLLVLDPRPVLMSGVPRLLQVPFTRLVHLLSLPLAYPRRTHPLPFVAGNTGGGRPGRP
ncbi:protein of unknown function [Candidatus Hydrogenisulfobacillus filiaventi]|uniref:Uncharacterized protein n=1 Tax=Candidatus Hydrogenisulfobacillus filiaventi TaxID=2707344 RepID=A0A6F8ZG52_9FIRM|nr:protein of unknown function [Candidatus Hydrogenisulfobacillus filiaventi]